MTENLKTQVGFDIKAALEVIFKKPSDFDFHKAWIERWSGATFFNDPVFGEQSFLFMFCEKKLLIEFCTADLYCNCDGIEDCDCHDNPDDGFPSWDEYIKATSETITLTEDECKSIRIFNKN